MKRLFIISVILLMSFTILQNGYTADQWAKDEPAGTRSAADIDAYVGVNNEALDRLLSNYQTCNVTYASVATLTVGIGEVVCSNSGGTVRKFRANTSTTTVTWANIDVSAEGSSTTYYVHAVADTDATTFTCVISTSSTAPTGVTYFKKIGTFYNNSDGNIEQISDGIKMKMGIGTGTAADDATIPLPTGYAEAECDWIVSPNNWWSEVSNTDFQGLQNDCSADATRVITATFYADGTHDGTANYLIIGIRDAT